MADTTPDASDVGSQISPNKSSPQLQVSVQDVPSDEKPDVMFTPRRALRREKDDDDEEEDLDALIEELESQDPDAELEAENETVAGIRSVREQLLQTDTSVGLIEPEVVARRKKYGLNQMKEEKENLLLKFLGYFVGPIQFVMEVCMLLPSLVKFALTFRTTGSCNLGCRLGRLGRFWSRLRPALTQR